MVEKTGNSGNLRRLIWAACCLATLIFLASNVFMLKLAGKAADEAELAKENQLVKYEIEHQYFIHAKDQSQISNWDDALLALEETVDLSFVKTEIADWLFADFGIQMSVVVDPANQPRVAVFETDIIESSKAENAIQQNLDLIEKAREKYKDYMASQTVPIDAFKGIHNPVMSATPIYVADFRILNGQLSTVVAQVFVPEGDYPMPGDKPRVFLTFKPFTQASLMQVREKLGLKDFTLGFGDRHLAKVPTILKVTQHPVGQKIFASWQHTPPSEHIWRSAAPVLAIAFLVVVAVLGYIARHFAATLGALQQSEAQNAFLALHDSLTGLPNRLYFDRELEAIITEKKQDRCAILCLDLDRFKSVNDTFGHYAGDVVLKVIAERLCSAVGSIGTVARVGGDEFIILLREHLDRDSVMYLCDQLMEDVCLAINVPGGTAQVGASIGVAWWPDDALTVKSIIRSADEALYYSKEKGRGQVSCASRLRRDREEPIGNDNQGSVDMLRDRLSQAG